jgi:hypothetical protein
MSSNVEWGSWADFAEASPLLAADVRLLFEQYGRGFAYLATIRRDGGPRIHPIAPVITEGGLYGFVLPSPKRNDLIRDGRYALHAYPPEHSDDEAYLSGHARPVTDDRRRDRVARIHRASPDVDWQLFEFAVEVAMVTHRQARSNEPRHRIWRADGRAVRG